jgi:GNAT superfamily N-acetyltransferase
MRQAELNEAVELVSLAMNPDEAKWARQTMDFYFACKKHDIDSGREYYVWKDEKRIYGLIGLHRYLWGPEQNVWLSWFAVHPDRQGSGAGSVLMDAVKELAVQTGYTKLLVETYDSSTFEKARHFYHAKGFLQIGRVENYLPDGSAMIVFAMQLE